MGFVEDSAAAAGMDLADGSVVVDERGLQHLVLIDLRRRVVARLPRSERSCRTIGDAAARLDALTSFDLPVPRVLDIRPEGGPGSAHLLLTLVPGAPLDEVDTDALPDRVRHRLVDELIGTIERIHQFPTVRWPSPAPDWADLWAGLAEDVAARDDLTPEARRHWLGRCSRALEAARRARIGLFHGDLGGVNCRIDPETGAVTGLLDWDSAAIGDTATDLVAVQWGVGPRTAAHLRAADPCWEDALRAYQPYVDTWAIQAHIWERGQRTAAHRLSDPEPSTWRST